MGQWRIGVDVGGTFTDLVAHDPVQGRFRIKKVPTVRSNPAMGVMDALGQSTAEDGLPGEDVAAFFHGTTIGTNALLEEKGARVGLLVTEGFTAIPHVQSGSPPQQFLLFYHRPPPLVSPQLIRGVPERVDKAGHVLKPIDLGAVRKAVLDLKEQGVTSIAVCYLFSFANPRHEQLTKQVIQEVFPECIISLSSEILPRIREWPRMSTTLLNAYLEPVLTAYIRSLDEQLHERKVTTSQRFLMQSNGGVMPFTAAIRGGKTHHTLLSGPAAGVSSAAFMCATQGLRNVISLDVGGTSADVAFVEGGVPVEVTQGVMEGRDVYAPMVDVEAISAGGGTIARVDAGGLLRVGPDSAGSDPGPACYGKGGTDPTITDADLVLGYLDPDYFLGGAMPMHRDAAEQALQEKIGRPLGSPSVQATAWGIVKVLEVKMADRIQAIASQKGFALREFSLIAGGGAGPLRAVGIMEELGLQRVIVPPRPGLFSAMGLLCADVLHDYVWTDVSGLHNTPLERLQERFEQLERQARNDLAEEGLGNQRAVLQREADVRYVGQGFELRVPVRGGKLNAAGLAELRRRFEAMHKRLYGHVAPEEPVEIVSFRVRARVPAPKLSPSVNSAGNGAKAAEAQPAGKRPMYFGNGMVEGAVYYRSNLAVGTRIVGPAVVAQEDSTTAVPPGWQGEVDPYMNLVVTRS